MKFSLMTYTMAPVVREGRMTLKDVCEFAKELEFEAIELSVSNLGDMPPAELREVCDSLGLKISCMNGGAKLTARDDTEFAEAKDTVRQYVDIVAELACPVVMVVAGQAESEEDKPRAAGRIAEGIQACASYAKDAGVVLSVEDFPAALAPNRSIQEVRSLLEAAPDLRLTFDNGNFVPAGDDPVDAFRALHSYVVNAHIKDWELAPEGQGIPCVDGKRIRGGLHGQGLLDHKGLFTEMKQLGYDGYLAYEYEGVLDHEAATREGIAYLRSVLAEL